MAGCEAGREQAGTEVGPPAGACQFLGFPSGPRATPRHELRGGCELVSVLRQIFTDHQAQM